MNKIPIISIIVPVYNVEQYLPRCIDSILSQSFTDFELLLIDDGSKDKSGAICDEYAAKDSRIRVFHKENGGVSSARNIGLDNAKGDWITFVDGDDLLLPKALTNITEVVENDNADLYIFDYLSNSIPVRQNLGQIMTTDMFARLLLLYKIQSSPWAKVYKAKTLNGLRFNTSLRIGEDWLFNFEFALMNRDNIRIIHEDSCIYDYIYREGSAMQSRKIKDKYLQLNRIAIPVVEKLLSGKMDKEVQAFKAINIFQSNWKSGSAPSKEEDEILMSIQLNEDFSLKFLLSYIHLLNINRTVAHAYFYYRKWKNEIKIYIEKI